MLDRHAPHLSGGVQRDAQEFCHFLLDKLSEDVNRIAEQPYVQNFKANGESVEEIMRETHR